MRGLDPRIFTSTARKGITGVKPGDDVSGMQKPASPFVTPTKVGVQLAALKEEAGFRLSPE
jgi:hypothetical protein